MAVRHILVVDDEIGIRELLRDILLDEGYQVSLAENASQARELRQQQRPDLVLLDIWMPDCDGISLLKEWNNTGLLTMPVVMMSGHGTIDTAVEATRIGAFDFLEKPIALQKLLNTVNAALKYAEKLPKSDVSLASLGTSEVIEALKKRLEQIALSKAALLLIGAKGGGAELCAQFLRVAGSPWLKLEDHDKLASAPMELLEQTREGIFYVPEVADLTKTQQKGLLLMVNKAAKYDVRVVCATARALPQMVENGQFEHALLQALSNTSLRVPALQDHREDIPDLANAMATLLAETTDAQYKAFDIAALNGLRNANWPGDLAQLESVVRNLMQTSLGEKITLDDVTRVTEQFADTLQDHGYQKDEVHAVHGKAHGKVDLDQPLREARDEFERTYFKHHLELAGNNMSKLAELSGLERTHLYRKLKQLAIKVK